MDQSLQILINREWTSPWADRLMAFVSDFGAWAPWLLLLIVLGVFFGDFKLRSMILAVGIGVGISDGILVNLLKHAVARPRPSQVEQGVRMVALGAPPRVFQRNLPKLCSLLSEPLVTYPLGTEVPSANRSAMLLEGRGVTGRSFPSGHAANNMAAVTVMILFYRRRGVLYLPVALLICYSRIYTGAHWPIDVLAGMLLGILGGWLATLVLCALWQRLGPRLAPLLAGRHPDLTRGSIYSSKGGEG